MLGFTFRGIHTNAFPGLVVKTVNNPLLAARRIKRISVPVRDGSYLFEDGFENKFLEFRCFLAKGTIKERRIQARDIASWLNGTGDLVLDHEDDKTYKVVRTVSDVSLTVDQVVDEFNIAFETEPYQTGRDLHTVSEDDPTTLTVTNNGNTDADTVISVTGTGDVTISCGTMSFMLKDMTDKLILDSKRLLVYTDSSTNGMSKHTGSFIKLTPGINTITVTGDVSNITVQFYDTYI
jgi:phage-related protein